MDQLTDGLTARADHESGLIIAREIMKVTSRSLAISLGVDPSGFRRIEQGINQPRAETAKALDKFYGGILPYGMFFDPYHPSYKGWFTKKRTRKLKARSEICMDEYLDLKRMPR